MLKKEKNELETNSEIYLRVKIHPQASTNCVKNIMDDGTIKIDIAKEPVRGKANQELIKYLANEFDVSKENIKIISGAGEKTKLIKIKK